MNYDTIKKHLLHKQKACFLQEVLDIAPYWHKKVAKLQKKYQVLFDQLDRLNECDIDAILASVKLYSEYENKLLLDAYHIDLGSG